MEELTFAVYGTPIGPVTVACEGGAVTALRFGSGHYVGPEKKTQLSDEVIRQLCQYLEGKRKGFDLPLAPKGTPFQLAVWEALRTIPYGETRSYADVAAQVGCPRACRAVGMANNRNPIAIIVPCHRVVGKGGGLVGYAGGLGLKKRLLTIEKTYK